MTRSEAYAEGFQKGCPYCKATRATLDDGSMQCERCGSVFPLTHFAAYHVGFADGRRWAEADIANGTGDTSHWYTELRADARGFWERRRPETGSVVAEAQGRARGYRDTVARFEAGTLTRQMFEMAPRGGTR